MACKITRHLPLLYFVVLALLLAQGLESKPKPPAPDARIALLEMEVSRLQLNSLVQDNYINGLIALYNDLNSQVYYMKNPHSGGLEHSNKENKI